MKKILMISIGVLVIFNVFAAEKKVTTSVSKVTVFLEGAQITRESNVNLPAGKTVLKFNGLSPYVDKNSIRVKGSGRFTIMSVNHRMEYLQPASGTGDTAKLNDQLRELKQQVEFKQRELTILQEKLNFIKLNNKVISDEKSTTPAEYNQFKTTFFNDYKTVQMDILEKEREIKKLNRSIRKLNLQIQSELTRDDIATAEIVVTVSALSAVNGKIELSYYVSNTGWFPSYDIRVKDINSPVQLVYKANLYQNTGIDWDNVELTFSSASPGESANLPILHPYFLNFNNYYRETTNYQNFNPNVREVRGIVLDQETGNPVPFANISIVGKTIGTTTDMDGKFVLAIPPGSSSIRVAMVGYDTREVSISSGYLKIPLQASSMMLDEVVVSDYKTPLIQSRKMRKENALSTLPLEMKTQKHQTNFELTIEMPYSLKSNKQNLSINMQEIELESGYVYKSVPKINPKAFLMASITDWEQYNLLDGEANVYYENTFVGRSVLDLSQLTDTLEVSLGQDNGITIKRVKEKEKTGKQFIGSNKIEKRTWKISVRNNKSQKIKLILYDQVPVSNNEAITVNIENLDGGMLKEKTGEVTWELKLDPKATVEKNLEYLVKYPKGQFLIVE